jgi:tripartite-type tricarboxylate transporter receptor subunit TctC
MCRQEWARTGHSRQADQLKTAPVNWSSGTKMCHGANPSAPAASVPGLIADVKADPSRITIASAGAGSIGRLVGEFFRR